MPTAKPSIIPSVNESGSSIIYFCGRPAKGGKTGRPVAALTS